MSTASLTHTGPPVPVARQPLVYDYTTGPHLHVEVTPGGFAVGFTSLGTSITLAPNEWENPFTTVLHLALVLAETFPEDHTIWCSMAPFSVGQRVFIESLEHVRTPCGRPRFARTTCSVPALIQQGRQVLLDQGYTYTKIVTPKKPRHEKVTTVATDASWGSHTLGAGIAAISEDGTFRTSTVPVQGADAEAAAIVLAGAAFSGRLHILTDCMDAIELINSDRGIPGTRPMSLSRMRRRIAHGAITISWVKGHSGHTLNEAADRLAVSRRRFEEFGVPYSQMHQHLERIAADALEPVDRVEDHCVS